MIHLGLIRQPNITQGGGNDLPPATPAPHIPNQRAAKLANLRAHIIELEAVGPILNRLKAAPPTPMVALTPIPPVLFVDQAAIDRARAAVLKDMDKKTLLPEIVPGLQSQFS